jgi:hypothetical protein
MTIVQKNLTEAHHHLGDLLELVKHGDTVCLVNGTRQTVIAYIAPPLEYLQYTEMYQILHPEHASEQPGETETTEGADGT